MTGESLISGLLGGGLVSAIFNFFILREHRKRNIGDTLFRCLDGYFKVMDYRSKALKDNTYSSFYEYYRALFDLQWSEHQMWLKGAVQNMPYRLWLSARYNDYIAPEKECSTFTGDQKKISYKAVWHDLLDRKYYISEDPFIEHMNKVHAGAIDNALKK